MNEIPEYAEFRVETSDGDWMYYPAEGYKYAMDDAGYRSRYVTDQKVRVESRWQSDRTKWQPHGYYERSLWTGAAS